MTTPNPPEEPAGRFGDARPPAGYYGGSPTPPPSPPPPNHLVWSVVSLLLFLPLGVPAIVLATRVEPRWTSGDLAGADDASRGARTFALWATVVGVVGWVVGLGLLASISIVGAQGTTPS